MFKCNKLLGASLAVVMGVSALLQMYSQSIHLSSMKSGVSQPLYMVVV